MLGLSLVVSMVSAPLSALAGVQDFKLINKTGWAVEKVYVEASNADEWGEDVLGEGILATGRSKEIHFTGYDENTCKFDIRVEDVRGKAWEITGVDLCETSNVTIRMRAGKLVYTEE